jgi:hypothetical protein
MTADEAIRELRTFELRYPVRLSPGICPECSDEIAERRGHARAEQALADVA